MDNNLFQKISNMYYMTKLSPATTCLMGSNDVIYEDDRKVTALNNLFFHKFSPFEHTRV